MEARVDIGENDVVRIAPGQKAQLEVDAFKNRKFNGIVTEIANSAKDAGQMGGGRARRPPSSRCASAFRRRKPSGPACR